MITFKKLEELPEKYKQKILDLNTKSYSYKDYRIIIVRDVNDYSLDVYCTDEDSWAIKELKKLEEKYIPFSLRPMYMADLYIKYGKVLKNVHGQSDCKEELDWYDVLKNK